MPHVSSRLSPVSSAQPRLGEAPPRYSDLSIRRTGADESAPPYTPEDVRTAPISVSPAEPWRSRGRKARRWWCSDSTVNHTYDGLVAAAMAATHNADGSHRGDPTPFLGILAAWRGRAARRRRLPFQRLAEACGGQDTACGQALLAWVEAFPKRFLPDRAKVAWGTSHSRYLPGTDITVTFQAGRGSTRRMGSELALSFARPGGGGLSGTFEARARQAWSLSNSDDGALWWVQGPGARAVVYRYEPAANTLNPVVAFPRVLPTPTPPAYTPPQEADIAPSHLGPLLCRPIRDALSQLERHDRAVRHAQSLGERRAADAVRRRREFVAEALRGFRWALSLELGDDPNLSWEALAGRGPDRATWAGITELRARARAIERTSVMNVGAAETSW